MIILILSFLSALANDAVGIVEANQQTITDINDSRITDAQNKIDRVPNSDTRKSGLQNRLNAVKSKLCAIFLSLDLSNIDQYHISFHSNQPRNHL